MTNYAYIRVSDAQKQTVKSQEFVIKEYAQKHKLILEPKFIFTYKISGSKSKSSERGWEDIIGLLKKGDNLLVSDVDRLGRDDELEIVGLVRDIMRKGATLIFCRSDTRFVGGERHDLGKLFILLGEAFASVRFAEERSKKAKASCQQRKESGLHNGRLKGEFTASKLDEFEFEIVSAISDGVSKVEIAKRFEVTRKTLYRWLEAREAVKAMSKKYEIEFASMTESKKLIREKIRKGLSLPEGA